MALRSSGAQCAFSRWIYIPLLTERVNHRTQAINILLLRSNVRVALAKPGLVTARPQESKQYIAADQDRGHHEQEQHETSKDPIRNLHLWFIAGSNGLL